MIRAPKTTSPSPTRADTGTLRRTPPRGPEHAQLGLTLRPLTREERNSLSRDHGLAVDDVSGLAARAGVRRGDIVLGINGQPIDSVEEVLGVVRTDPPSIALLIERSGEKIFVPVQLG